MKPILLPIILGLSSQFLFAQDYTLLVKVKDFPDGAYAYLQYVGQSGRVIDSAAVNEGTVIMKGKIDEPRFAHFSIRKPGTHLIRGNYLHMYLEPGDIVISSDNTIGTAKITGSAATDDMYMMLKEVSKNSKAPVTIYGPATITTRTSGTGNLQPTRRTTINGDRIYTSTATTVSRASSPEVSSVMAFLSAQHKTAVVKFIMANPSSFVSMISLNALWKQKLIEFTEFYKLLSSLDPAILNSNQGRVLFPQ